MPLFFSTWPLRDAKAAVVNTGLAWDVCCSACSGRKPRQSSRHRQQGAQAAGSMAHSCGKLALMKRKKSSA